MQDKLTKNWHEGTIIKKLNEPRFYLLKDENRRTLRRNTSFLKKRRRCRVVVGEREVLAKSSTIEHYNKISKKNKPKRI